MREYIKLLKNAPVFNGIEEESIEKLLPVFGAVIKDYSKGEYILKAGEMNNLLGIILEGKVHIIQEEYWGNRNILSAMGPGQNFGEAYACAPRARLSINVVAEAECRVVFLNVLRGIENSPAELNEAIHRITLNLLRDMAGKNIYFTEKLTHIGERTTRGKIISYLSSQRDKAGSTEFKIPFSRQELADYLFVDRSGLSAELCRMRDEGLIWFNKNHFKLY